MDTPTNRPPKRTFLQIAFFWICGICCLITWNSIMSLSGFWTAKFSNTINTYYAFMYMFGALCSFFTFDCLNKIFSFYLRIYLTPIIMSLSFVLLYCIGDFMDKSNWKNTVFLVVVF